MSKYVKYGKETLKLLSGFIYPGRCAVCGKVLPAGEDNSTCQGCTSKTELVKSPFCMKCGKPLGSDGEFCMDCMKKETSFICGRAVFVYNKYMKKSIESFKYYGRAEYAKFYAAEMFKIYGGWIEGISPDALIPVPVHINRMLDRGYNQAGIIADILGELTGIQVIHNLVVRRKDTVPQKELSERERKDNLHKAFEVVKQTRELYQNVKCVIIIDDIYTTGSTIEECSYALKCEHIESIYFLCTCIGKGY
ncbi:MAG: ComF family protein [Lachnospiraceae bacterium]|nr:ComF family protein [Lachnospiraceae bacterium]